MASNLSYKESKTTKLSLKGIIDSDNMTINVDDVDYSLHTLLSDYNGGLVNLIVQIKEDLDLDIPEEDDIPADAYINEE